jgi:uncharacterized membrane protein
MKARARLLGHPVHQMLVVFPLGLLATSVVFDIVSLASGATHWPIVAYWTLAAGIVGGLVAAPFGFIDWLGLPPGTRAKRIGALHGGGNLLVVLLFLVSWWLRTPGESVGSVPLVCSLAGATVALFTAWLGGELVSRLGVGVHEGAHVNASSSLTEP